MIKMNSLNLNQRAQHSELKKEKPNKQKRKENPPKAKQKKKTPRFGTLIKLRDRNKNQGGSVEI